MVWFTPDLGVRDAASGSALQLDSRFVRTGTTIGNEVLWIARHEGGEDLMSWSKATGVRELRPGLTPGTIGMDASDTHIVGLACTSVACMRGVDAHFWKTDRNGEGWSRGPVLGSYGGTFGTVATEGNFVATAGSTLDGRLRLFVSRLSDWSTMAIPSADGRRPFSAAVDGKYVYVAEAPADQHGIPWASHVVRYDLSYFDELGEPVVDEPTQ